MGELSSWIYPLILVAAVAVFAVFFARRYLRYRDTSLSEQDRDVMADFLITSLRENCGGPDRPIKLLPSFWPSFGWSHPEVLRLLEYVTARGWMTFPNYSILQNGLLFNTLPDSAALTPDSYERWTPRDPQEPSVVFNGPTHLGEGDLVNNGTITYEWTMIERDVSKLALGLHRESLRHDGDLAQELEQAAETLSQALETNNLNDPWVKRTVRWVADLANGTAANIISAGLIAAATALLGKL